MIIGEIGIYDTYPGEHKIYTDVTGRKDRKAQVSIKPKATYYVKFSTYDNYYINFVPAVFISDEIIEKDALRDLHDLCDQVEN